MGAWICDGVFRWGCRLCVFETLAVSVLPMRDPGEALRLFSAISVIRCGDSLPIVFAVAGRTLAVRNVFSSPGPLVEGVKEKGPGVPGQYLEGQSS
jgi:hypothetical protein